MKTMTLDKAIYIVETVVKGRLRLGKQFTPPFIMDDVLDALVLVYDSSNIDAPTQADVTLLRRQLAACQNREKARRNKELQAGVENASPGGPNTQSPPPPDTNPVPAGVQLDMFEVPDPESTIEA